MLFQLRRGYDGGEFMFKNRKEVYLVSFGRFRYFKYLVGEGVLEESWICKKRKKEVNFFFYI